MILTSMIPAMMILATILTTTRIPTIELPVNLVGPLALAAARSLALAGIAAAGLFAFRAKGTSTRLFVWRAVLYSALAMPILQLVLPPLPVVMPAFVQTRTGQPVGNPSQLLQALTVNSSSIDSPSEQTSRAVFNVATPTTSGSPRFHWNHPRWTQIAMDIYMAGVCFLLARLVIGLSFASRLRRASQIIHDARMTTRFGDRAHAIGLSSIPVSAESEYISVPVTMGVLRPVVLFPSTWREWDDAKLDAVIAHEISHVARRDTLTQRLSLLHCTIFWFSPLAWWLDRHLADLVEQASDEAALALGVDNKDYAKTLLSFIEALQGTPHRVWWQGVSMANAGRAEQRVERILAWKGNVTMSIKKSIAVLLALIAVPAVYLTAAARPADRGLESQGATLIQIAQEKTPDSPAVASRATRSSRKSSQRSSYSYGYDDNLAYVLVSGSSDSLTMSGSKLDAEHVEKLKETIPGDFLWFRRDEKAYIIRDQSTLDRAKALWAPQEELGKKQEELGKQQEALGAQQEELGKQMEQIHVKVPDLTKELEHLQSKLKQLNSSATTDQIAQIQSDIGELQEKIGQSQSEAGEQQSKLGAEMGALGEKQGKLGEQQGELGRQQGELAEQASRKMKSLIDESVTKGTAQPEK